MPCRCDGYDSGPSVASEIRGLKDEINKLEDMLCYVCVELKAWISEGDFDVILSNKPGLKEWHDQHVKNDKNRVLKSLMDANFDLNDKRDVAILKSLLEEAEG